MRMKVSKLSGAALDWGVAKAKGFPDDMMNTKSGQVEVFYFPAWKPSTDWAQGGPIIDKLPDIQFWVRDSHGDECQAAALSTTNYGYEGRVSTNPYYGTTKLVAAMRCYVASKLGDEIDVPEELLP